MKRFNHKQSHVSFCWPLLCGEILTVIYCKDEHIKGIIDINGTMHLMRTFFLEVAFLFSAFKRQFPVLPFCVTGSVVLHGTGDVPLLWNSTARSYIGNAYIRIFLNINSFVDLIQVKMNLVRFIYNYFELKVQSA